MQAFVFAAVVGLTAMGLFLGGLVFDAINQKTIVVATLSLACMGVLFLPIRYALIGLFFYIGFEGMAKILSNYNPVIHVGADLLVMVLVAKLIFLRVVRPSHGTIPIPPLTILIGVHITWFVVSFANPYAISLYASMAGAKMYVTMVLLYFFGFYQTKSIRDIHLFIFPWIAIYFVQVALSMYQGYIGPESVTSIHPRYGQLLARLGGYAFRPFGTSAVPGGSSIFIFLTVPLVLYVIFTARSITLKVISAVSLVPAVGVLFLCQVRSAILKSIIGGVTFLTFYMFAAPRSLQSRIGNLAATATVCMIIAFGGPKMVTGLSGVSSDHELAIKRSLSSFQVDIMTDARQGAIDRFMTYLQEVPLGAGLSRTGAAAGKFKEQIRTGTFFREGFFTDNFFVATLVDLGIPGMAVFCTIIFLILIKAVLQFNRMVYPETRAIQAALFASLLASVAGFYGAEAILYNPESCFFWFFSGVLARLPDIDQEMANPYQQGISPA